MSMTKMLSNFDKIGAPKSATSLIVGIHCVGKNELAKAMVDLPTSFSLQVRTANSLPLGQSDSRPKIDQVIFVIDLTNRHSLYVVEKSLNYLDVNYFLGKVCFVATQVGKYKENSVDIEKITQLADTYDSPIFKVNVEDDKSKQDVAERLVRMLEIAAGFKPGISPLLLDTTRIPYQSQDL